MVKRKIRGLLGGVLPDPEPTSLPACPSAFSPEEERLMTLEILERHGVQNAAALSPEEVRWWIEELCRRFEQERKDDAERGRKVRLAGKQGGRPKDMERDAELLRIFKERRQQAPRYVSDSQLAAALGKGRGISRRAVAKALARARKKVGTKPG